MPPAIPLAECVPSATQRNEEEEGDLGMRGELN
jgi:hypothetical protein